MHEKPRVIHEDRHLLILDKPSGMPTTNLSEGIQDTLQQWLLEEYPKQYKVSDEAGLVNRIDNDTSGIVVAARSEKAYTKLKDIWTSKDIIKEYTALVLGQIPAHERITNLIAHHPGKSKKMMVVANEAEAKELKARYADTELWLKEGYFDYSLITVRIITGMRHQIRCHLASIGFPIAGDKLYQKAKHNVRDWLDIDRLFLHASRVKFLHPTSGKEVEFISKLPFKLEKSLEKLS